MAAERRIEQIVLRRCGSNPKLMLPLHFVVSSEETTLIGRISDVVRSGSGSDLVAYKERGTGDGYTE